MQVGPDFQLGTDTVAFVDLINNNDAQPTPTTPKHLKLITSMSLDTLLQYERDKLIDDE